MLCLQEPALFPLLRQIYLVLVGLCYYLKVCISTTIPSTQKAPSDIPTKNMHALPHACQMNQTSKLRDPSALMRTVFILMRNLSIVSYLLKLTRVLQIVSILFLNLYFFTDIRRQSLFNIISFLLDPRRPAIFKLLDATVKMFLFDYEALTHSFFHLVIIHKSAAS